MAKRKRQQLRETSRPPSSCSKDEERPAFCIHSTNSITKLINDFNNLQCNCKVNKFFLWTNPFLYNFDQSRSKIVPSSNFCFLSEKTFLLAKQEGFTLVLSQFVNFLTTINDKCNERRKNGFSQNHQIVTSSFLSHTPSFIFWDPWSMYVLHHF